jgi:uncharacterized membrane protein YkoI
MKKTYSIILILSIVLLAISLVGCSDINYTADRAQDIVLTDMGSSVVETDIKSIVLDEAIDEEDISSYNIDLVKNGIEYKYYINATTGAIITKSQNYASEQSISNDVIYIGVNNVKTIALENEGLIDVKVTYTMIKLVNDTIPYYGLEFIYNGTRYNYEIYASSGYIKNNSSSIVASFSLQDDNNTTYIGIDKAKYYVLNYSDLLSSEVIFTEYDLIVDEDIVVYKLVYTYDNIEYKFEITAKTGTIFKHSTIISE